MRYAVIALLMATATTLAPADCKPEKMVKVVYREVSPGVEPGSFASMPKTLYRFGTKYARSEEEEDATLGIHGLMVVNEPDIWMLNLATKTGQHIIDTGAPYHFHAPIVGAPGDPKVIVQLECGCEFGYLKAHSAEFQVVTIDGAKVDQYKLVAEPYRVAVSFIPGTQRPVAFALYKQDKLIYDIRYLEYATDLEPRLELFAKPEDISFEEAE